jgi:hypothetical protein
MEAIMLNKKEKVASSEPATLQNQQNHNSDNSTNAQQQRLLSALKESPKSTIELRRDYDILAPAVRIFELKKKSYQIITNRVQQATDCGKLHLVAYYTLLNESGAL